MKTIVKSMLSAFALTMFIATTSFAQDAGTTGTMQDDQTTDTYNQDQDTYGQDQGTTQDGTMQSQDPQLGQTGEQGDENRTQIAQEDLPSEVSNALEEGEYADYTVAEAYEVDGQNGEKEYEIHFQTPEGETQTERFSESGEVAR